MSASEAELHDRLSQTARRAVRRSGLALDDSGERALDKMITRATARVDGTVDGEVQRAELSLVRFAQALTDAAEPPRRSVRGGARQIDDRQVEAALLSLCPGFWPFC